MADLTVYTKPNCRYCDAMKKDLARIGMDYTEIDLATDDEAMEKISALYSSAPVLEVREGKRARYYDWAGYRSGKANLESEWG